ncbi:MAG TPA: response regulator transcription factor [Planktothrix sp.]|jgi:two-component system OmpR family response regulator
MRILLCEDDELLSDGISKALRQAGYAVDQVSSGQDADHALETTSFDMLILDLGLPKVDGLEVLRRVRQRSQTMPVMVVTARDRLEDRVTGLDLGADDYMTKPFDLPELEARVRALLRRGRGGATGVEVVYGPLRFDTVGRRVTVNDQAIELSARELAVLEVLLQRDGSVVSKEQLIEHMYGWDEEVSHNAMEVNVHRLRKKLEPSGVNIRTIRGLGYLLEHHQP